MVLPRSPRWFAPSLIAACLFWLSASLEAQHTTKTQSVVHAWFAAHPNLDPGLRLKVLEASGALDRTVRIRTRFPE